MFSESFKNVLLPLLECMQKISSTKDLNEKTKLEKELQNHLSQIYSVVLKGDITKDDRAFLRRLADDLNKL